MKSARVIAIFFGVASAVGAHAYELATHGRLTYNAYLQSVLSKDDTLLEDFGLNIQNPLADEPFGSSYYDLTNSEVRTRHANPFESSNGRMPTGIRPLSVPGWLMRGAIREDDYPGGDNPQDDPYATGETLLDSRPLSHFYDPVSDRALNLLGVTVRGARKAPEWGIGSPDAFGTPNTPEVGRRNHFTVFDAREALYRALTGKDKIGIGVARTQDERNKYWATVFRALGDVAHLIQDMAQPQHTRNDLHAGIPPEIVTGHASVYEAYVEARAIGTPYALPSGQSIPNRPLAYEGYPLPRFTDYASYFSTRHHHSSVLERQGMADYSNRGFFSAGTNLGASIYAHPSPLSSLYGRQRLDINCLNRPLGGAVELLTREVRDSLHGTLTVPGVPLTTFGVWDEFLEERSRLPSYTLNCFNYDAMADLLIPRAVAYSAGLIDYFFRGRLEAEDPEFSDSGVRLKVRNAIDVKKFPEWTTEHLYREDSQGKDSHFVLTLNYREGEEEKLLASEPVSFKTQQLVPPGVTSFEVLSFDLPAPPEGATDIEYRLVFRGRLGEEDDAIAVGMVEPVSGFVVRPNYVGQNRLIVKTRGDWRVQPSTNTNADHIDWKGWYFNGRPTKVLSWTGPVARYFPNVSTGFDPFGSNIYQNGEVFARAPCRVLGAAITKDDAGKEWLLAICKDADADVLYRRPNTKNGSATLFDPVFAPEGWEQIDRIPSQPGALPADVPWFFNGDGTEAQTMRLSPRTVDGALTPLWRDRYKISINNAESVVLVNLGNEVGTWTDRFERICARGEGVSRETHEQQIEASTVIAADYVDKKEILARLQLNVVSKQTQETVSSGNSRFEMIRIDSNTEQVLKWDDSELNLLRDRLLWDRQMIGLSGPGSKGAIADEGHTERKFVIYFDMRSDFLVYFEAVDQSSINSNGVQDCNRAVSICTPVPVIVATKSTLESEKYQFVSKTGPEAIYENSTGTNEQVNASVTDTGACRFTTQPENRTVTRSVGGLIVQVHSDYHPFVSNRLRFSGATDSGGNHVLSMQYRDVENLTHWFNFLTDGDLAAIIPNAPPMPTYFPVYVVK